MGRTGLNVGGFATAEVTREEGDSGSLTLEGINFLLLFEPVHFLRAFSEIEVGRVFAVDTARGEISSAAGVDVDRLYGEVSVNDRFNLRLGEFLTPVGRWNPVPAEPFTWTTSEPLLAQRPFDSEVTGAMLHGSLFPPGASLTYSLYGQFLDALDPDPDPPRADRSLGMRLEYTTALADRSAGASFLACERRGQWHHLGGLDAQWRTGPFEFMGELLVARGNLKERDLWGAYVQVLYQLMRTFYLVARYEHVDPAGAEPTVNLADHGVAWVPVPYLRVKADYQVADRRTRDAPPGFHASFSLLF